MDEKPESVSIESSLGWKRVMPDTSLELIAIPGSYFSLLENNENKTVLVQALNKALAISYSVVKRKCNTDISQEY